jgi:hypothetical protein
VRKLIVFISSLLFLSLLQGSASAKVSPQCTDDPHRPTWIGGTLVGYPDGNALDAHLGVSIGYRDSTGKLKIVMPDGSPNTSTQGDYSFVQHFNSDLPSSGDPIGDKTWGMCVWGGVTTYFAEVYPKAPVDETHNVDIQVTDKSTYGASAFYSGVVTSGETVDLLLRLPHNDVTGGVQGYITYQGNPVSASNISKGVRAFPGPGATCGIEGYSASADELVSATGPTRTYYKMTHLAGGQCGAPYQRYSFQMTCFTVCGATRKTYVKNIAIVTGTVPRFDVNFT